MQGSLRCQKQKVGWGRTLFLQPYHLGPQGYHDPAALTSPCSKIPVEPEKKMTLKENSPDRSHDRAKGDQESKLCCTSPGTSHVGPCGPRLYPPRGCSTPAPPAARQCSHSGHKRIPKNILPKTTAGKWGKLDKVHTTWKIVEGLKLAQWSS